MHLTYYEPTEQDYRDLQAFREQEEREARETQDATIFHLPELPYTPIDALNRRAAAMGSPGYTQACAYANYNGHRVGLHWNEYRRYYIAEYYYGERVVLRRGSFAECLAAVLSYYDLGHLGACASISPREDDAEALELCRTHPRLVPGNLNDASRDWWTWKHVAAGRSVRDYANPHALRMHFDWELMDASETEEQYEAALTQKYGRAWTC